MMNIENKSAKNLDIVWEKTWYLQGEATKDHLLFCDASTADNNLPRAPETINAVIPRLLFGTVVFWNYYAPPESISGNNTLKRFIFPLELLSTYPASGLFNEPLPDGDNGVLLTIKVDDREITEKMWISVKREIQ
ncbi:MAG: hypothetical protein HQK55_11705 [Deltaproteobacteria bacterium]|nr:hypothetical protein [Deltaproteobacteria bacterium]